MDDVKPDDGIVITCNDFTEPARVYAKGKGIRLVTLRVFQEEDWEGKLREIELNMVFRTTTSPTVELKMGSEDQLSQIQRDFGEAGISCLGVGTGQPIFLNVDCRRVKIDDFVREKMNAHPKDVPGSATIDVPLEGSSIQVDKCPAVPLAQMTIRFEVVHEEREILVGANILAELLVSGCGDSDLVVFDDELRRYRIDSVSGHVTSA